MKRDLLLFVCLIFTAGIGEAQVVSRVQASPACPNNICPGIGNSFPLQNMNAASVNTGGTIFFNNRRLGDCVMLSDFTSAARDFASADSMERFISQSMAEANLSGSYSTKVLTMSGTAQAMSGSSSDVTTTFHSTNMDITTVMHAADFQQSSKCFAEANVDPAFLKSFQALALITGPNVSGASNWNPYVEFLRRNGSHIMIQQLIGSRFQQWESSTSKESETAKTMRIKACAEVEGTTGTGGWSVASCGAYSNDQKKKALETQSTSKRLILGSTTAARAALLKDVNKTNLDAFIDAAEQGDQAVRFVFKPLWELLYDIYTPACEAAGNGSPACNNLQRAVNLQAAYEGWTAVGCPPTRTANGVLYQFMEIEGTTSQGIATYQCTVLKTGCVTNNDCRLGGAGSVCFCYGPSCLDQGNAVAGTTMYRNNVRGNRSGNYNQGVNNSCTYRLGPTCGCNVNWSGGLLKRTLYMQSTPGMLMMTKTGG